MTSYKAPTPAQVDAAMRRITKSQLRRAFFEGIENPLWVKPLADAGAFGSPPEPVSTGDGYVREAYWPEATYLARAAPDVPQEVVDVLLTLGASNNSWVRRAAFEIGAKIPAEYAAQLKPLIKSWKSSGLGWRTDPRDLVSFAVNLFEGGQPEVGKWFANLIFRPSGEEGSRRSTAVLEDYWYEDGLPGLVAILGPDGLGLVLPWLVAYERQTGHLTDESDLTYFSRDSIRVGGDDHDGVEHVLINAVRDLAIKAILADAIGAKNRLLQTKMLLARKIALFALSQALQEVGDDENRSDELLGVARELLLDEESSDESCRIDFADLARAVARTTGEPVEQLTQFIEPGPRIDRERLRDWMREDTDDETEVDKRVQDYVNHWKHRWLSAIGPDALPAQLQSELAQLDSTYGVIERPLEPTKRVTTWTGPNSPVAQDEMAAMSPTELVGHLESWHDTGSRSGPEPSHEGQGRELTALLTTNPKALAGVENLVERLRPTYLRSILRGWEAALKADLDLDWEQTTDLIGEILDHSDGSAFPPEGDRFDDDVDFRPAKQAAVGLLEELVKQRTSPTVPDDALARFAEMLIGSAADETAWREYSAYDGDGGMDPLTTSLNWQWPARIRGLIYLMSRGVDKAWYEAARTALDHELARVDARGASRAVVGEGLARLLSVDPEWIKPKIPQLFGSDAGLSVEQQIALTTAMAIHRYHPTLYDLLGPSMIAAIRSEEPIISGWRTQSDPLQRIGEWIIDAIIHGHKTIDDPVAHEFFSAAPPKVRGEALGHIAWAFMHAEAVDDPIRDRFAVLWDARVTHVRANPEDRAELDGFHWFVRSHKFAVEWWLPRLREALELDPKLATERYMIGKEIASSADVDPRGALEVLKLLLAGRGDAGLPAHDLTRHAVPMVIARAMTSGDPSLEQDAVDYMNQLGEQGHLSLETEVNRVLEGAITQADIDE